MAKDEPKQKPPTDDPIQAALDAVERATGEKIADDAHCDNGSTESDDQAG